MAKRKLGRLPRAYDARVPHYSALRAAHEVPSPLPAVDWSFGMPADVGAMGNDHLGDCTIAAIYHAIQVWTFNAGGAMQTSPDCDVIDTYGKFCGYVRGQPSTDNGGVEQFVLRDWIRDGVPTNGGDQKLTAFVEVDPRNHTDLKRVVQDCGIAYLGISVPAYVLTNTPKVWDIEPNADNKIDGGHALAAAGYDERGLKVCSWGEWYVLTWAFLDKHLDESYALVDADWLTAKGTTLAGWTLPELQKQMQALRGAP